MAYCLLYILTKKLEDRKMKYDDLYLEKEHGEIIEIKDLVQNNNNILRVYCIQYPNDFRFQIRTYKPTNFFGRGKKRNMMANVSLSIKEVENILAYMKKVAA